MAIGDIKANDTQSLPSRCSDSLGKVALRMKKSCTGHGGKVLAFQTNPALEPRLKIAFWYFPSSKRSL